MNLFGLKIEMAKKGGNNKYILKNDCHRAMDGIHHRITELSTHLDKRFDAVDKRFNDIKDWIKNK